MSSLPLLAMDASRGFAADRRFARLFAVPGSEPVLDKQDPVSEAFERGHAQGYADALADAEEREAQKAAAQSRIELAFARLDDRFAAELEERLRHTVLALCEQAVAPLAIDPDGLRVRVERAMSLLQRKQEDSVIRLHPEDLALVEGRLPKSLVLKADPAMQRGALRVETSDGGVEDGPAQWRAILAEAIAGC